MSLRTYLTRESSYFLEQFLLGKTCIKRECLEWELSIVISGLIRSSIIFLKGHRQQKCWNYLKTFPFLLDKMSYCQRLWKTAGLHFIKSPLYKIVTAQNNFSKYDHVYDQIYIRGSFHKSEQLLMKGILWNAVTALSQLKLILPLR